VFLAGAFVGAQWMRLELTKHAERISVTREKQMLQSQFPNQLDMPVGHIPVLKVAKERSEIVSWADSLPVPTEIHTGYSASYPAGWLAVLYIGTSGRRYWTVHLFARTRDEWKLISIGDVGDTPSLHIDSVYIDDAKHQLIIQDRAGSIFAAIKIKES